MIAQKQAGANTYMQNQRNAAAQQMGQAVPVPPHAVAGITFADGTSKPIEHAVGIKAYNGASAPPGSGLPGQYCYWDAASAQWKFSPLNNLNFNYVQRICEEAGD